MPHSKTRKKKKRQSRLQVQAQDVVSFETLLKYCCVEKDEWDAFVITDGSANSWGKCFGYAAVLIDIESVTPRVFSGGGSSGTSNVAEMLAVLSPLMELAEAEKGVREHGYRVHIVSDSDYVVKGINRDFLKWLPTLKKNKMLWLMMHGATRSGLVLKAHWIPRDTIKLNRICHDVANSARRRAMKLVEKTNDIQLDDFTP